MPLPDSILIAAIRTLHDGPRSLEKRIRALGDEDDLDVSEANVGAAMDAIFSLNANSTPRLRMVELFQHLDAAPTADWNLGTAPFTIERRARIHERLGWGPERAARWDEIQPIPGIRTPTVIAEEHVAWYSQERKTRRPFYWNAYRNRLAASGWEEASVQQLDGDTDAVIAHLSDPERTEAYATRGLVVGYVQSGKTANFTGVIAKAADAGYRLVIVLAGVLDILREQTQRRLDKELLGWEICGEDGGEYATVTPAERSEFVLHGAKPELLGSFGWDRLTTSSSDYQALASGRGALRFERAKPNLPLNHPENLHSQHARILIVKKNRAVLSKLKKDLKAFEKDLIHVPTLVIDDESDQAGLNTAKPGAEASAVNKVIREILQLLPRGQYVGYTATPFANVFVNPEDPGDLFPRDFIVCLQRPFGYVGLREFFGIDLEDGAPVDDLETLVKAERETPLVQTIEGDDTEPQNLRRAIDLFVLTGAIKLYRASATGDDEKPLRFKHHTMLVHSSARQAAHSSDAEVVEAAWDASAFHAQAGMVRLEKLWKEDVRNVSAHRGASLPMPTTFDELRPHIAECVRRIDERTGNATGPVLIVNGNEQEATTPNFERDQVWKILVGGNKLSRGYTVEGLTISYYRRTAATADTLMQMGRWFGFRRGYADLVRLFAAGQAVSGHKTRNLVEDFIEVCWMEEELRRDLRKYAGGPDAIRPRDVRPLVAWSANMLPTAKNRMRSAEITGRNFSGGRATPTLAPVGAADNSWNMEALRELLAGLTPSDVHIVHAGKHHHILVGDASAPAVLSFLEKLRWSRSGAIDEHLDFIRRPVSENNIRGWRLVLPQLQDSADGSLGWGNRPRLSVIQRARIGSSRFNILSDPAHVKLVNAMISGAVAPAVGEGIGVLLVYLVRVKGGSNIEHVGWEAFFPGGGQPGRVFWRVRA
jgi:Z1 domain